MSIHFPESGASLCIVVAPEDNHHNNKCPLILLSSFLLAFIAEQASSGVVYPFGPFGSAVPAMSHPKLSPSPSPSGEREVLKTAWLLWEHSLAVAKTLVCEHLPDYKHKAQCYGGCYGEN